ncbi:hypothetical protein F4810DRAFT_402295 [Camillea tinctor]|nr:hypothetical protein F4810DRAFT_402295 [Camillea tinctor]
MLALRPLLPLLLLTTADLALSALLNVTAVGAHEGRSRFECWELSAPFVSSSQPGIAGTQTTSLGDVANITYNVVPAGFESPFHTAPVNQWVIVLTGLAILTLPDNSSYAASALAASGELGLLFAADTPDVSDLGHGGYFPGAGETVFVQIPTRGGGVPEHRVVSDQGPCGPQQFVQLRAWATES